MIRRCRLVCAAALAAVAAASAAGAQDSSNPPGAAIVLPHKLVSGERATLAVLDAAGHLTKGAVVEFTGGERVTTDATGRAAFTAPATPGVLLARLAGLEVSA
jgi:hypothetical protein